MKILLAVAAVLLMLCGTLFIFAAALGVMRFPDPLQRMHAATKAGTIGAVMVLLGTLLVMEQPGSTLVGLAAIGFLLITVPIAAHLLGRAVYVSGAQLLGLLGKDALHEKLSRSATSLEERIDVVSPDSQAEAASGAGEPDRRYLR